MNKLWPALLLLSACASTTPSVQYYLLQFEVAEKVTTAPALSLQSVTVPEYLGQRGIALRTTDNSLLHAQYHRWGEPLQAGIRRSLQQAINQYSGVLPEARLDYHVDHFYGTPQGQVTLVANWSAELGGCQITGMITREQAQTSAGYAALVAAKQLLLADSMHALLRDLTDRAAHCDDQSAQ